MPFYVRDLSVHLFWYLWEILELTLFVYVSVHLCARTVELLGCGRGGQVVSIWIW